ESIVTFNAPVQHIHAGLLALGAKPGTPVKFEPEYTPPTGQKIEIAITWLDEENQQQRMTAQQWIRHATHRYFEVPLDAVPPGVVLDQGDRSLRYDPMNSLLIWFGTMTADEQKQLLAMSNDEDYQKAVKRIYQESQPVQMNADF